MGESNSEESEREGKPRGYLYRKGNCMCKGAETGAYLACRDLFSTEPLWLEQSKQGKKKWDIR